MSDLNIQIAIAIGIYLIAMGVVLLLVHIFTKKYNDK